jgi:hypothetical protein
MTNSAVTMATELPKERLPDTGLTFHRRKKWHEKVVV